MLGMLKLTALRICESLYSWEPRQSSMISFLAASRLAFSSDWSHSLLQNSYSVSGILKSSHKCTHSHTLNKALLVCCVLLFVFSSLISYRFFFDNFFTNFTTTKSLHHLLLLVNLPGAHFFCISAASAFLFVLCFTLSQKKTHTHTQPHTRARKQETKHNFLQWNLFPATFCVEFSKRFFVVSPKSVY